MPRNFVKPYRRMEARRRIEEMVREQALWGQRLMGERQLAAELGVSRRTVQGALAALEAEGILERRQGAGTFVVERQARARDKRTARLAIIARGHPESGSDWVYQGEIIRGMLRLAPRLRAECTVLSVDDPEEKARIWSAAEMRGFDGFISVAQDDRELISHLLGLGRGPVVLADHYIRDLPITCVVDGSFEGARAVTRHLLALGHRRISFIDCYDRAETNPEKFAGYRAALIERDIEVDDALVACPDSLAGMEEFVHESVARLLAEKDPPTAIFCFDDWRALVARDALRERGLCVGRDFSLAGFGDSAIRRGAGNLLTSCRIYARKMGQESVRAALATSRRPEGRTIIVPDRLYIRKSTCPPPGS